MLVVAGVPAWGLAVSHAAATPQISGADGDVWALANPVPTYELTTGALGGQISWSVDGGGSSLGTTPLTVKLPGIADGAHTLTATDLDLLTTPAERTFRVDLTPPRITIGRPSSGAQIDQNAAITADYSCEGAVSCTGTVASGSPLDTSSAGPATFSVRAADDAGNGAVSLVDYVVRAPAGPSGQAAGTPSEPISLVQTPTTPTSGGTRPRAPWRPRTINARALRPVTGILLPTRRPLLRWRERTGVTLYNVQIYRLRGTSATKVVSVFPRTHHLRVPAGRVAFGQTYIWRVWPYVNGRYTSRPLGLSYFSVRRRAAATPKAAEIR